MEEAPAEARALVCIGLSQTQSATFERYWADAPWPVRQVERPQDAYMMAEYEDEPMALVVRAVGDFDPLLVVRVFRANGVEAPAYILCDTTFEANYYIACDTSDVFALTMPLDPTQVERVRSACRYETLAHTPPAPTGEVDEVGLARLMVVLAAQSFTGIVHLDREQTRRSVHFFKGEPTYAQSNLLAENFGQILCSRGIISPVEYQEVQELQAREGIRQGEALVKMGVLTNQGLFESLREQIQEKILNAFVSGKTHYSIEPQSPGESVGRRFELNLMDILYLGLWQTAGPAQLEQMWGAMARRYVVAQPRQRSGWPSSKYVPSRFLTGLAEGRRAEDIFESDTPLRNRVGLLTALSIAELVFLTDEVPTGVRLGGWLAREEAARSALHEMPTSPPDASLIEVVVGKYLQLQDSNHFNVLEVGSSATLADIERAYAEMKEKFAPEQIPPNSGVEEQLACINARLDEAYQALGEDARLSAYADSIAPERRAHVAQRDTFVDAEAAYELGMDMLEEGDIEAALEQFQHAQALNSGEPLFQLYEGVATAAMSEPGREGWMAGKALIARALARNPLMAHGQAVMARLQAAEGDFGGAMESVHMALQLDPLLEEGQELLRELEARA